MAQSPCPWWGSFAVDSGEGGRFRIGPLRFSVERCVSEWRIASAQVGDHLDAELEMEVPAKPPFETRHMALDRFGFDAVPRQISIAPKTADRPVAARPVVPFHILEGHRSTLYVSHPLWVQFAVNETELLHEVPIFRPSDTWVGKDTTSGELCYAARTPAVLARERLVHLPHRVTTEVRIKNLGEGPFLVERITLPVQSLSVFVDEGGGLWTESISVHRQNDDVKVKIGDGAPRFCPDSTCLATPRVPPEGNIVVRAFSRLFG